MISNYSHPPLGSFTANLRDLDKEKVASSEIMFMPWGQDMLWVNGKSLIIRNTGPEHAEIFNAQLQRFRRDAAEGKCLRPFIDINHDEKTDAGEPIEAWWAGRNGIRMAVNWAQPINAAIVRGEFTSFSPELLIDTVHGGVVTLFGISARVGGLLRSNVRPGFSRIQPIKPITKRQDAILKHARFVDLLLARDPEQETLIAEISKLRAERPDLGPAYDFIEGVKREQAEVATIRQQTQQSQLAEKARIQMQEKAAQFIRLVGLRAKQFRGDPFPSVKAADSVAQEFPDLHAAFEALKP